MMKKIILSVMAVFLTVMFGYELLTNDAEDQVDKIRARAKNTEIIVDEANCKSRKKGADQLTIFDRESGKRFVALIDCEKADKYITKGVAASLIVDPDGLFIMDMEVGEEKVIYIEHYLSGKLRVKSYSPFVYLFLAVMCVIQLLIDYRNQKRQKEADPL